MQRLERADQEAETMQKSFRNLLVGEWAELYMEYAFNTFTDENCKLAKEKQRAFRRFFETGVLPPHTTPVSNVRKKGILDVFNVLKKQYSGKKEDRNDASAA